MNAKNVMINGQSLDGILRHYYALSVLIREVKRLNGSFVEWDRERTKTNNEKLDVKIEIQ
jgi:hypothetical protein